jgi:Flp pilus assembly protein TadB
MKIKKRKKSRKKKKKDAIKCFRTFNDMMSRTLRSGSGYNDMFSR